MLESPLSSGTLQQEHVFNVSELSRLLQEMLGTLPSICVRGEISNFMQPRSGHWYFSLKDDKSSIRAACFRGSNQYIPIKPENGLEVEVTADVAIYPARGDLQLIVKSMKPVGEGDLQEKLNQLKNKLLKEGLFESVYKKPLPTSIHHIGIITSETGAAIRDILSTIEKREPWLDVTIYPTLVQGKTAAPAIVKAIEKANQDAQCDVLIMARGGGSLEDLWSFNEESVARAVFASHIPIVCGVGHETDTSIADWVADVRAPTPTGAAVMVTTELKTYRQTLNTLHQHLCGQIQKQLQWLAQTLDHQRSQLKSPKDRQMLVRAELFRQFERLTQRLNERLNFLRSETNALKKSIEPKYLNNQLYTLKQSMVHHYKRLNELQGRQLMIRQNELNHYAKQLDALSPLSTLGRGYTLLEDENGHILDKISQVKENDRVGIRFSDGLAKATIDEIVIHESD